MALRIELSEDSRRQVKAALKAARTADDLRRVLCVWLPVALGIGSDQVAVALGLTGRTVQEAQQRFRRRGVSAFHDLRHHVLSPEAAAPLRAALKRARTVEEFRNIQCVSLRAILGLDTGQVAAALGWPRGSVSRTQSRYLRMGAAALKPGKALPPLPEDTPQKLRAAMKNARGVPEFRRAQCLYMRVVLGLSSSLVAQIVGWRQDSVSHLLLRYSRQGEAALQSEGRGGVRRQILTTKEEDEMLNELSGKAWPAGLLMFTDIHSAYEARAHRPVKSSTVQAMLDRHGWHRAAVVMAPHPHPPAGMAPSRRIFPTRPGEKPLAAPVFPGPWPQDK